MVDIIRGLLREHQRFVITGHTSADPDSIGSCIALALALEKLGKEAMVILDAYPGRCNLIPGAHFLWKKPLDELTADVFIAIDCGSVDRLGKTQVLLEQIGITVNIDHHETNPGFAQYNWVEVETSSASEMVYDLIAPLVDIDADISIALYAGIVSDTGGFRFNRTSAKTMEIVSRLVATGIPYTDIYTELLYAHGFTAVRALGVACGNAKRVMGKRVVFSTATLAELKAVKASPSDLSGVARYFMSTRKAQVAFFANEESDGKTAISLRSNGLHVGQLAAQWNGGGHQLAAGCTMELPLDEAVAVILKAIKIELDKPC